MNAILRLATLRLTFLASFSCAVATTEVLAQGVSESSVILPALEVDGITYWDVSSVKNVRDESDQNWLVRVEHRGGTTDFPGDLDYDRGYSLNLTKNTLEDVKIEIEQSRKWISDEQATGTTSSIEPGKSPAELISTKPEAASGDSFIKAIKGDSNAMVDLALQFHFGLDAPWDLLKSDEWLQKASSSGNETAEAYQIVLNLLTGKGGDADHAFAKLKSAADRGNERALLFIGLCRENGWGCKPDPSAALLTYEEFAATDEIAVLFLGNAHAAGVGGSADHKRAIAVWEKVKTPFAELQFRLAQTLIENDPSPADRKQAQRLLESASSKGYVPAMLELSVLYLGEARNSLSARELGVTWTKAALEADPENKMGLVLMGACHLDGYTGHPATTEAFVCFAKAASLGDGYAMTVIGQMAEQGIGTAKDPERAFLAYQRAAAAGNLDGVFHLGRCYRLGIGTQMDLLSAAITWKGGVEADSPACMGALAECYFMGMGVDVDTVSALELCKSGIKGGDPASMCLYGKHLVATGGRSDQGESGVDILRRAADQFNTAAMMEIGRLNEDGVGMEVNLTEAFNWYLRAAIEGDPFGMYKVGECYQLGRGRNLSHEQAAIWWRMGAVQNQPDCLNALAMVFKGGFGIVPADPAISFEMVRRAAEAGSKEAECNLALCYFEGIGTTADEAKGLEILVEATRKGNPRAKPILARYRSQVEASKLGPLGALLQAAFADVDPREAIESASESWRRDQQEFWQSYQRQAAYDRHIRNVTGKF